VVAAGEDAVALEGFAVDGLESFVPGNLFVKHQSTHTGALEDVADVAGEPVRDVDGGARQAAQRKAELDARLRLEQALRGARQLGVCEAERRAAERARDPQVVPRARARAAERRAH